MIRPIKATSALIKRKIGCRPDGGADGSHRSGLRDESGPSNGGGGRCGDGETVKSLVEPSWTFPKTSRQYPNKASKSLPPPLIPFDSTLPSNTDPTLVCDLYHHHVKMVQTSDQSPFFFFLFFIPTPVRTAPSLTAACSSRTGLGTRRTPGKPGSVRLPCSSAFLHIKDKGSHCVCVLLPTRMC